jgi:PKD repeat protein
MAIVAAFKFDITGTLTVTFTDLSSGGVASREWDFGDGNTSTDENPVHVYSREGYYTISLTVSDGETIPETDVTLIKIGLASHGLALNMYIIDYVKLGLPSEIELGDDQIRALIQKWQTLIGPVVIPAITNYYSELNYPISYGQLIADLVLYDIIIAGSKNYLLSIGQGNNVSQGGKQVKAIETGPARAEWFSGSEVWADIMKVGGLFDQVKEQACSLASALRVQLYFCKQLSKDPVPPQVYVPSKTSANYPLHWENELLG